MNLYLTLIGIISTISCVLIIICINSKSADPSTLPSDGSKSPLQSRGLNDAQKSQILLIVCVIFFMSLVTTNVKTSKFSVIFHNFMASFTEEAPIKQVTDFREVFYGSKGSCQFRPKTKDYPYLFDYLKDGHMETKFFKQMLDINLEQFSQNLSPEQEQKQKLLILNSHTQHSGSHLALASLSQTICKSSSSYVPVIYLDLEKTVETEQQLMKLLKLDTYDVLKQSVCKLNGVDIKREVQRVGNYLVQKETYSYEGSTSTPSNHKVHLIINNFEHLNHVLIFGRNVVFNKEALEINEQTTTPLTSLKPQYELFIDKLLNDLINNCKINVILHTSKHQELRNFYDNWKRFNLNTQIISIDNSRDASQSLMEFPFEIRNWKGISKIQFYEILKELGTLSGKLKGHESSVWKLFQKSFGKILNPAQKISVIEVENKALLDNNEQLTLVQLQIFFKKLQTVLSPEKNRAQLSLQSKFLNRPNTDLIQSIAQYYGLQSAYQAIKSSTDHKTEQKGVSLSSIKRKVPVEEIRQLQKFGIVFINEGRVFLAIQF